MTYETVSVVDVNGQTWIGWRKDGQKPIVDLEAMRYNANTALRGALACDYVDRFGPQPDPPPYPQRDPHSWVAGDGYERQRIEWMKDHPL